MRRNSHLAWVEQVACPGDSTQLFGKAKVKPGSMCVPAGPTCAELRQTCPQLRRTAYFFLAVRLLPKTMPPRKIEQSNVFTRCYLLDGSGKPKRG